MDFDVFWKLVENHGSVACYHKNECENLWMTFSHAQQQAIYNSIERKLNARLFVHYNPVIAIRDNKPKTEVISYDEHYRRYNTDIPQDGFRKIFLPEQQKTIYVKGNTP